MEYFSFTQHLLYQLLNKNYCINYFLICGDSIAEIRKLLILWKIPDERLKIIIINICVL